MPTAKTECTELSVGFGLLNIGPLGLSLDQIQNQFSGTLAEEKYVGFIREYDTNPDLYRQFIEIGRRLRTSYPLFTNLTQINWCGPQQQAATTTASMDLVAANVPISIKNNSNVVLNPSPYNMFITIPSGSMPATNADNWYEMTGPREIADLYTFVQEGSGLAIPRTFSEFDLGASKGDRKNLQEYIKNLVGENKAIFDDRYMRMCRNVSTVSADMFNDNYQTAFATNIRSSLLENIVKQFFRINGVPYILVGLDSNRPFGLQIPDITDWKRNWKINELRATPDLTRRQSVVDIRILVEEKSSKTTHNMDFHVEIRWSHGKFCGNPEAKLYKEFPWSAVPFFRSIL